MNMVFLSSDEIQRILNLFEGQKKVVGDDLIISELQKAIEDLKSVL